MLALAIGAVVEARTITVLAILIGARLEGFASLGTGAAMVRLAVGARALRAGVLPLSPAVPGVAGALLAVVVLAVGARGSAAGATATRGGTSGAWWAPAAAVAVGMGRFHWRTV